MKEHGNYMTRADFCDEAKRIVTSDRNEQYGEPEDNFGVIAELWSTYLTYMWAGSGQRVELSADNVALMMVLFKIGRAITAVEVKDDTVIDAIGYLACAGEIGARERADFDRCMTKISESAGIDLEQGEREWREMLDELERRTSAVDPDQASAGAVSPEEQEILDSVDAGKREG